MNIKRLIARVSRRSHHYRHYFLPAGLILLTLFTTYTLLTLLNVPRAPKLKEGTGDNLYVASNKIFNSTIGTKSGEPKVTFSVGDSQIGFVLAGVSKVTPTKSGNTAIFPDVLPDTDLHYTTTTNGLKEELIIKQYNKNNSNVYLFDLILNNVVPRSLTTGLIEPSFKDQGGNYRFHFDDPFAVDARGNRTNNVLLQIGEDKQLPGKYYLKLIVDEVWLSDPARVYPITIDPTVVHDTTAEFAAGQLNRLKDTGPGATATLESYYQELVADQYTVGLWHMNEGTDNTCSGGQDACDKSGNGNHGTFNGNAAFYATTKRLGGYATIYDGTGDYTAAGDIAVLDTTKTLSGCTWVNLNEVASDQALFGKNNGATDGWYIFRDEAAASSGRTDIFTFYFADSASANSTRAETATNTAGVVNIWHHLCFTFEAAKANGLKIYYDGIPGDTADTTLVTALDSTTNAFTIGARSDAAVAFNGVLDETIVSTRIFTPEEIKLMATRRPYSIYTSDVIDLGGANSFVTTWNPLTWNELGVNTGDGETLKDSTSLVAQWNFNETSGTTADNAEGTSARDGTLSGFDSTTSQDADPDSSWTANNRRWGAGALQFDGTDSYVDAGSNAGLHTTSDFTVESWFKTSDNVGSGPLVSFGTNSDWLYYFGPSAGKLWCKIYQANSGTGYLEAVSTINSADGVWHHTVCTISGTTVSVYIDGKIVASSSTTAGTRDTSSAGTLTIGKFTNASSLLFKGVIDSTRIYSRVLTPAEIMSNYQAGNVEFQTRVGSDASPDDGSWEAWKPVTGETAVDSFDTPLAKSLVGYWPMDESSSTRFDRWGISSLTANGTGGVGTGTGKLNSAADFESTESDFLEITDNASLSTGDIDFTVSAWVYMESKPTSYEIIASKYESFTVAEYLVGYTGSSGSDRFYFQLYDSGGTGVCTVEANNLGSPSAATWYNIVVWHDAAGNTCNIKINNGTTNSSAESGVVSDTTSGFRIGAYIAGGYNHFDGLIDEVGFWKRTLSSDEISYLYSSGAPKNNLYGADSTNLAQFGGIKPAAETVVVQENSASTKYTTGRPDLDGSTVGLWHLDETGGTGAYLKDSTANANNGTPTGTTVVNGIAGKARSFNGTSDYVRVTAGAGSSLDLDANPVTMEAWIKPDSITGEQHIISRGTRGVEGYGLVINFSAGLANVGVHGGSNFNGTTVLAPGQWYHIAGVINGASSELYVNGNLDATGTVNITASNLDLHIGSSWNGSAEAYFFDGTIDEVRVSNVARTAEEIAEAYRAGRDHYINKTISSTDLSAKTSLPFYVAADRPGTYLESIVGESAFANYQPDSSTVGQWHLDETTRDYAETPANTSGLVGWWHMNESSGNVADSSGNSFTGTVTGTTVVAGRSSYSRSLNGSASDYITVTENDALDPAAITVEAWIKPNVLQTGNFVNKGDNLGYRFRINTAGTLSFFDRGGTNAIGSVSTLASGTWYHVAATGDSSGLKIYINGVMTNSNAVAYGGPNTANNLVMGYYSAPGTEAFSGTMDEVRIFNRALTAAEIAHDAAFTQPKDVSGNANHGSLWGTSSTQGKLGKGRNFNGTSDRISISNINIANSSFTLQAWAKRGVIGVNHVFLGQGAYGTNTSLHLGFRNTNVFMCAFYGNDLNTTTTFTDTNWHLWTCTYDASTNSRKLYQDGILIASNTASADYQGTGTVYVGSDGAGGSYFNGLVDEVRIDNTVRTADEIRQAYEVGLRTHPITIDFGAKLDSGNLITGSSDLGFTVDATYYGLQNKGDMLFKGDKVIVRENYDGTEYIAQGTVTAVTASTGAVTVAAWDSGSTFPSGGYTVSASVFKWQREYWNINNETLDSHMDAITNLTLRLTDGSEGRTIWLDDLKSNSDYLTTPGGSTITSSTGNRYFQYRAILSSFDEAVSATLSAVTVDYVINTSPAVPSLDAPTDTATNQLLSPVLQTTTTDADSDYIRYKIELCENLAMTTNCQTFDQTSSQTGWSGQNAQASTAYTSGTQATYTIQTPLTAATTYYWRSYAIDPAGTNTFGATQGTPYSFTTNAIPAIPTLNSPSNEGTSISILPQLQTTTTDADSDYLRYKIELCENLAMTTNCQTFNQVSSQTGWSGQNTQSSTAYTSGTQATYTLSTKLIPGFTYFWRSYAIDPAGSNTWSNTQTPASFTTHIVYESFHCRIDESLDDTGLTVLWTDRELEEDSYKLEKSTDGGAFAAYQTLSANTTSYLDTTIAQGHTYQYRVAAFVNTGSTYGQWCTTNMLTLEGSPFNFSGLNFSGLNLN